jgi:hypothetical protein
LDMRLVYASLPSCPCESELIKPYLISITISLCEENLVSLTAALTQVVK